MLHASFVFGSWLCVWCFPCKLPPALASYVFLSLTTAYTALFTGIVLLWWRVIGWVWGCALRAKEVVGEKRALHGEGVRYKDGRNYGEFHAA